MLTVKNLVINCAENKRYGIEKIEQPEYRGVTLSCWRNEEKEIEKLLAKGSM